MHITTTNINSYAPALWSPKDVKISWKTALVVGVAAAALCLLGVALRRLYHAYWSAKDVSKVDWDACIRLEKPYKGDTGISETARQLLKESGIQECQYKLILIMRCSSHTTFPIFGDDGVYADWYNPDHYKGDEILLICFPVDKKVSHNYLTRLRQGELPTDVKREINTPSRKIPKDIHVKVLSYGDWHGWFGSFRLSERALECFSTAQHNLNIPTVKWKDLTRFDDPHTGETALHLLYNLDIKECPYKIVFIKRSAASTADPIFSDDGVFADWENDKHFKGSEILLVYFPADQERSQRLNRTSSSTVGNVKSGIAEYNKKHNGKRNKIPDDIHIKLLSYEDWHHDGWFNNTTHRLSKRALECLSTTKHNLNIPEIEWDKVIRLERPYYHDLETTKTALELLKKSDIQETPYKQILIKQSRSSVSDPTFTNDGVYAGWDNPDNYKGHELLLIVFPTDKRRSNELKVSPNGILSNIQDGIKLNNKNIPTDIHVKILTYDDWNGWFGKERLSERALECFSTAQHNLNIQRI